MPTKKKKETEINTGSWLTTYTDLMTLLLTFFVLLLSIAVIDKTRKRLALNSLVGAFGFKPGAHSIIGKPKGTNITAGSAPLVKENVEFERLRNIAMKTGFKSETEILKESSRIIITFSNRVCFQAGSSQIEPDSIEFLSELASVIKDGTRLIELRGYTDPTETVFEPDPFKVSMRLSSKRAFAVYHFLREKGGIPAKRMVAHGFGTNTKGKGGEKGKRELNRQVEIILDHKEKTSHRLKRPKRKDSFLDFNGFFFRTPGDDNE